MLKVLTDAKTSKESEPEVDAELDAFSRWLVATERGGELLKIERATIKSYLYWKLWAKEEGAAGAAPSMP